MLKVDRHKKILDEVIAHKSVESIKLSELLEVSIDTIRRDIVELEQSGKLKRVRGGASMVPFIPSRERRETETNNPKHVMAKKAMNLIEDGQTLIFGGGTTNLHLISLLPTDIRLTIFTNSIPIAYKLCEYPHVDGVLLGGNINNFGLTAIGYQAVEFLSEIWADYCFLGISGVHMVFGLTETNRSETIIQKAFINSTDHIVALAHSSKLSSPKPYKVADIDVLDVLVTELEPTDDVLSPFIAKGIKVL
ncbi:MAG: DeoR/GlpR family DNA-binding transcription regulator [Cytophagales bacterium]|nr:DeoR/GlpR family DNA-binding transcription regulator [Cytophagales bacterium]